MKQRLPGSAPLWLCRIESTARTGPPMKVIVHAPTKTLAARWCLRRYGAEPSLDDITQAGYSSREHQDRRAGIRPRGVVKNRAGRRVGVSSLVMVPRQACSGKAPTPRGRALPALTVYRSLVNGWPTRITTSEGPGEQRLKDFIGDVGREVRKLPPAQRRLVEGWLRNRIDGRRLDNGDRAELNAAFAELDAALDGETAGALYASLVFALKLMDNGIPPGEALETANRFRRVGIPRT